jgi:TatD DNase family protein
MGGWTPSERTRPPVLVDTHCHLHLLEGSADELVRQARTEGVGHVVDVGVDLASSRGAAANAARLPDVSATAGIHPHDAVQLTPEAVTELRRLLARPEVVAVGETGLDYYRDRDSAADQRASFVRHLALAAELGRPAIVHNREADEDVLRAIADWGGVAVLHCFVGDRGFAERALALGCYLGLGGPLTFKSSQALRETASQLPLDRILLETDSPYLAPAPHRGQRNEPAHVRLVAERLAEVRGLTLDEVACATSENARRVFGRVPAGGRRR